MLAVTTNEYVTIRFTHMGPFRLAGDALIFEGSLLLVPLFSISFMSPLDSSKSIILMLGCFYLLKLNLLFISSLANISYFISLNSIYRYSPLLTILETSLCYIDCKYFSSTLYADYLQVIVYKADCIFKFKIIK